MINICRSQSSVALTGTDASTDLIPTLNHGGATDSVEVNSLPQLILIKRCPKGSWRCPQRVRRQHVARVNFELLRRRRSFSCASCASWPHRRSCRQTDAVGVGELRSEGDMNDHMGLLDPHKCESVSSIHVPWTPWSLSAIGISNGQIPWMTLERCSHQLLLFPHWSRDNGNSATTESIHVLYHNNNNNLCCLATSLSIRKRRRRIIQQKSSYFT